MGRTVPPVDQLQGLLDVLQDCTRAQRDDVLQWKLCDGATEDGLAWAAVEVSRLERRRFELLATGRPEVLSRRADRVAYSLALLAVVSLLPAQERGPAVDLRLLKGGDLHHLVDLAHRRFCIWERQALGLQVGPQLVVDNTTTPQAVEVAS